MNACSCNTAGKTYALEALRQYYMGRTGKRAGMCPTSVLEGCSALWGADPIVLAPGATGTLTWPTQGVFFDAFAPLALIVNVTAQGRNAAFDTAAGAFTQTVREDELERLIQIDAIRYQGDNRLASRTPINLETFRCCNVALGVACLGIIEASSNDLEVDLTSVIDPASPAGAAGLDLQVSGTLIGWEIRGSRIQSMMGPCPTEPEDAGRLGFLPPGSVIDAQFTAKVGNGGGTGGGSTMPAVP